MRIRELIKSLVPFISSRSLDMASPEDRKKLAAEMLASAEEFRRAAMIIERAMPDPHITIPMTNNYAFSAEMYLKFLLCTKTTKEIPEIHDLRRLFKNLPVEVRDHIKKRWETASPIELAIRAHKNAQAGKTGQTFEQSLSKSANSFVAFRYHYESKKMLEYDGTLGEAFRRTIFDLYPAEFKDIRLPLPPGVPNTIQQGTTVTHAVRPPTKGGRKG
jgi:hypothetical protein